MFFFNIVTSYGDTIWQRSIHLWEALERSSLMIILSTPSQGFFKLSWAVEVPARSVLIFGNKMKSEGTRSGE